jgi:hypothetical protein
MHAGIVAVVGMEFGSWMEKDRGERINKCKEILQTVNYWRR